MCASLSRLCAPCGSRTEGSAKARIRLRTGGEGNRATVGCVTGRTGVQRVTVAAKERRRERERHSGLRLKHLASRPSCRHWGLRRKRRFIGRRQRRRRRKKLRSHKPTRGSGQQDRDWLRQAPLSVSSWQVIKQCKVELCGVTGWS